jgi:replicative DNA helicase
MDIALEKFKKAVRKDRVVHISDAVPDGGVLSEPTPIGYTLFDEAILGGVREGDLIISTGLSGHGKTSWLQNITVNMSKEKINCLWFTYEVIPNNLFSKFKDMGTDEDNLRVYMPKQIISGNLDWVTEKIEEGIAEYGTKFVFIDHIDFLSPTNLKNTDQQRMVLRSICTQLKSLAVRLRIVIFLVAHVRKISGNRKVEMQDIAESSGIFQLADFVFAITRDTIKEKDENGKFEEQFIGNRGEIKILKNRLTGETPKMSFELRDNIILPEGVEPLPPKYFNEMAEDSIEDALEILK